MSEKRKCIFTGQIANFSMRVTSVDAEKHNWAKSVPCTKEFFKSLGGRPLNKNEFQLVELFYEQEVSRLNVARLEEKMEMLRDSSSSTSLIDLKKMVSEISDINKHDIKKLEDLQVKGELSYLSDLQGIDCYEESQEDDKKYAIPTDVIDNAFPEEEDEKVTEVEEDVKITKVVKKRKENLWG